MFKYDKLLQLLEDKGYNPNKIIKEDKILGAKTYYQIKHGETNIGLTDKTIDRLCDLLDCSPSDIITYVPNKQ